MVMMMIMMMMLSGAVGAGLHCGPGTDIARVRVSETSDRGRGRVTARDNKQELRMRSVPGSGQVRIYTRDYKL